MWHPWRTLRDLTSLDLYWTLDLPAGVRGATDGHRIWMDPRQLQAERRSTLAHELAHLELGHIGVCGPREEEAARQLAARWLITMPRLLDALAWSQQPQEIAEDLWVDVDTLYARLAGLTPEEQAQIAALSQHVEHGH